MDQARRHSCIDNAIHLAVRLRLWDECHRLMSAQEHFPYEAFLHSRRGMRLLFLELGAGDHTTSVIKYLFGILPEKPQASCPLLLKNVYFIENVCYT